MSHHVLIAGTGRAGTTFLLQLLGSCGLDTGADRLGLDLHPHANAGLEVLPNAPGDLPYVIKSPWSHLVLEDAITRCGRTFDHLLIPMRNLEDAAESRVMQDLAAIHRSGGADEAWPPDSTWDTWGVVPGGITYSLEPLDQARILAVALHRQLEAAVRYETGFGVERDAAAAFAHISRAAELGAPPPEKDTGESAAAAAAPPLEASIQPSARGGAAAAAEDDDGAAAAGLAFLPAAVPDGGRDAAAEDDGVLGGVSSSAPSCSSNDAERKSPPVAEARTELRERVRHLPKSQKLPHLFHPSLAQYPFRQAQPFRPGTLGQTFPQGVGCLGTIPGKVQIGRRNGNLAQHAFMHRRTPPTAQAQRPRSSYGCNFTDYTAGAERKPKTVLKLRARFWSPGIRGQPCCFRCCRRLKRFRRGHDQGGVRIALW
jgi:hypothetical protein